MCRRSWCVGAPENYEKLTDREKTLHAKAFCVNDGDPHFRDLETLKYHDGVAEREVQVPKGDVLHQFRKDVEAGQLPTVSWLVAPEAYSDHPSSAWYGAWYISEALEILTKNPEVWKKTIFILTYDENDGYFDHVPPFTAPNPNDPTTGGVSDDLDAAVEFVTREQDLKFRPDYPPHESSIGLGFRVPFVVASPWSRGGCVNSQVFDHTSVLQFMEHFLSHKTGKRIQEPNISAWRRAVCGDLTSIFQPYHGGSEAPSIPARNEFIEGIHQAKFKSPPTGFKAVTEIDIERLNLRLKPSVLPQQEPGTRPSCPLPYELYADGSLDLGKGELQIRFKAGNQVFGNRSAGSAFNVYAYQTLGKMQSRAYSVSAGKEVSGVWNLSDFGGRAYHVRVDGPNGFMRNFTGAPGDPIVDVEVRYEKGGFGGLSGDLEVVIRNRDVKVLEVVMEDIRTGEKHEATVSAGGTKRVPVILRTGEGWYDFTVSLKGHEAYQRRCAGRGRNRQVEHHRSDDGCGIDDSAHRFIAATAHAMKGKLATSDRLLRNLPWVRLTY